MKTESKTEMKEKNSREKTLARMNRHFAAIANRQIRNAINANAVFVEQIDLLL